MTTKKETALAKAESFFPVPVEQIRDLFQSILEPGEHFDLFSLQRVTVPSGGGLAWQMPDGEPAKAITGVMAARTVPRSYWAHSIEETGSGSPPDCTSRDGVTGIGDPGGDCETCPYAQFSSGKGNAQACKQRTRLFILDGKSLLPLLIDLGPSVYRSLQSAIAYLPQPWWHNRVSIGLVQAKNAAGITYSKPEIKSIGRLTPEQCAEVDAYRVSLLPLARQLPVVTEEDTSA